MKIVATKVRVCDLKPGDVYSRQIDQAYLHRSIGCPHLAWHSVKVELLLVE
jgi:hypothetical protein